jgi:hypothetical protein
MTRPWSEPYCRRRRLPPSSCFEKRTSTSPLTNGPETSLGEQNLRHRRRDVTRTNNPTSVGRRGLVKRSMPWTTRLSCPRGTPRRRTNTRRHPRCLVPIPQGHAPHPPELQILQALCWEWPTLPTSTTSPTMRRARRTSTTLAAGRRRRWSIPARRRGGQRHLRRTRVAREQKEIEAQQLIDTGGNHQCPRHLLVVRTPDHLYPGRSMAQLRSSGQVPAPRRSCDPREQGKESISGRGKQRQRHLPPDTFRLGSCTQRAPRVRHSFLRHCADRRRIPAWTHLHACYLWNSGKL